MPREIHAIVFDFDGLILDTETAEVEGWRSVFRDHGKEFPDSVWIATLGRGASVVEDTPIAVLERDLGRPLDHDEIDRARRKAKLDLLDQRDALPGVRDALAETRALGLGLAVASSSPHVWVDGFLARLGLLDAFDAILCEDDVATAKPAPDLYLAAMAALGRRPESGIALEDSPMGIQAAKAANLYCVAVPNALTAQLDLSQADLLVRSLADISIAQLIEGACRAV